MQSLRKHWLSLVRDEQIVHIVRVLFFNDQNSFQHDPGARIVIREKTNQLA